MSKNNTTTHLSLFEKLTLFMQLSGLIVTITTVFYLGRQLEEQSAATEAQSQATQSSTYQGLLDKQLEVDKIFIDNPDLRPYIFDKMKINKSNKYYNKILSITEYQLDFFQMVWSQKSFIPELKSPNSEYWQAWKKYFQSTIKNNSLLCDRLKQDQAFYSSDFVDFALKSCPVSITLPQKQSLQKIRNPRVLEKN